MLTTESFNQIGVGKLPGLLGIVMTQVDSSEVSAELLDSKLSKTFARQAGYHVTTRNWATVLKLLAASTGALRPGAQK
jgi:hypothetical protein